MGRTGESAELSVLSLEPAGEVQAGDRVVMDWDARVVGQHNSLQVLQAFVRVNHTSNRPSTVQPNSILWQHELLDAVAEIGPLTDDVAEGLARKTPQADVAKVQLVDRCLL